MKLKLAALGLAAALAFAAQPAWAGLNKISTVTASGSASIQFTGLNSTYNTYFVNCTGLLTSIAEALLFVYVGEGASPTWETSASYTNEFLFTGTGALGPNGMNTGTGAGVETGTNSSITLPNSFRLWIDNVSSTTTVKNITLENPSFSGSGGVYYFVGSAYWNADTNAITGLEIVPGSGNISAGTCTLYGLTK